MDTLSTYNIFSLPFHEATLDEEDSHFLLSKYLLEEKLNYYYRYPTLPLEDVQSLAQSFCFFAAKIQDASTGKQYIVNTPLQVFRFMLLKDGSWDRYYTINRKPGYVVEGMFWSNGLIYQVRDDKAEDFETHQLVVSIDSLTKTMHNFPDV